MPAIIIPGRVPMYRCRVCPAVYYRGEESAFARHAVECAAEYHQSQRAERARLDFLKPQDPEFAEWIADAFRKGQVKPSTEIVQ